MGVLVVDSARCAHDSAHGETVVLDTLSGAVVMITGSGSAIWNALAIGADTNLIVEEAVGRYGSEAAASVRAWLDDVQGRSFLVEHTNGSAARVEWAADFVAPGIEVFDELAEIMTMDPIHEVDPDRGWPHKLPRGG